MFWLRALVFASPLAILLGAATLFRQVERLRLPVVGDSMICSIQEPIGSLNPLVPLSGVDREVRDLIFDPLLIRDDDLNLRPHLISEWQEQTVITIRCSSEEAAGEVEAKIRSGEYLVEGQNWIALDRLESVITVALEGFDSSHESRLINSIEPENLGDYQLVRLSLNHSIRDSLTLFLNSSVEKGQIKMIDYDGDQVANLFLKGETDLFLREFELYYESNRSLDPEIEVMGDSCFTSVREMILKLHEDVRWHDGRPITSADLIFSFEELTQPGSPMPMAESFWFVDSIAGLGDHEILVTCGETPAMMMESWEKLPLLPEHLLAGKSSAEKWETYFANPISFGPYRVERRREDGGIELMVNEAYFRPIPLQKRIVYRRFESLEAKLLALRSGQIDMLVPDQRFVDWAERNPGTVRQLRCLPRFQQFVAWNLEQEPLSQNDVRLALAEAIDLEDLLRDTATEYQEPVRSLFFPGGAFAKEAMPLPLLNPRSAESRLEKAGFRFDESRGVRIDREGNVLSFVLSVNESNGEQLRLADALANQWAGIGVVVDVEPLSWEAILTGKLMTREFDALLLSWEVPLERDRFSTWHSSGASRNGGNLFGLKNQVVDQALSDLRWKSGKDSFPLLASKLQEEIAELQPCFFLCQTGRILWFRKDAVESARVNHDGEVAVAEPGIGKSGLERARRWWVKVDPKEEASEK